MAQQLKFAAALADVPVQASCFCRLDTAVGTSTGTSTATGSVVVPGCCGMDN